MTNKPLPEGLEKIGLEHPEPCPDCGAKMVLALVDSRLRYRCEQYCGGNVLATVKGEPWGIPINRAGRQKRRLLHEAIDPYWDDPKGTYWQNSTIRSMIYQYLLLVMNYSLVMNMDEFHVAWLNHEQLDRAMEIAQNELVSYMELIGVERKETIHVENV